MSQTWTYQEAAHDLLKGVVPEQSMFHVLSAVDRAFHVEGRDIWVERMQKVGSAILLASASPDKLLQDIGTRVLDCLPSGLRTVANNVRLAANGQLLACVSKELAPSRAVMAGSFISEAVSLYKVHGSKKCEIG